MLGDSSLINIAAKSDRTVLVAIGGRARLNRDRRIPVNRSGCIPVLVDCGLVQMAKTEAM